MLKEMVDRFLAWPLPPSVNADACATTPSYPHPRSGTNLLNATEAEQMLEHVAGPVLVESARLREALEGLRIYVNNPSAWDSFSQNVSDAIMDSYRQASNEAVDLEVARQNVELAKENARLRAELDELRLHVGRHECDNVARVARLREAIDAVLTEFDAGVGPKYEWFDRLRKARSG